MTIAISANGLAKWHPPRAQPAQRFWQALRWGKSAAAPEKSSGPPDDALIALHPLSFELAQGKVLGIIGKNGAGKSTLLQLLAGTLEPSAGTLQVNGRVAALLELGAGFNPDFTGIENVYLNAAILGMSRSQTEERMAEILDFADIGDFVERPVKTYSSGMFVRLAFSVAVCLDPQILIIDEALSVGDGQFARKSFQRIMALKDSGRTILFCSHSLYQVESLCDQAIWLDRGRLMMQGDPADVLAAYSHFLEIGHATAHPHPGLQERLEAGSRSPQGDSSAANDANALNSGQQTAQGSQTTPSQSAVNTAVSIDALAPRLVRVRAWFDGLEIDMRNDTNRRITFQGNQHSLLLEIHWAGAVPQPTLDLTVAATLSTPSGQCLTAVTTLEQPEVLRDEGGGHGYTRLHFPDMPLRKGIFRLDVLLGCGRALQLFDHGIAILTLDARSTAVEQGLVSLPHRWEFPDDAV